MPNTVWIVSELYYPEETSMGYSITRIAERLGKEYEVRVLCAQPGYSKSGTRAPLLEIRNGIEIRRCFSTMFPKNNLFLRAANLSTFCASIFAAALLRFRRGDCVLAVSTPPLLPYAAMLACRLKGAKCVVRVDDVYPEAIAAAGLLNKKSFPYKILDWLSLGLYRRAERIAVLGRDMKALISDKAHDPNDKIRVIESWADIDLVSPAPKNENSLLRELGLTDKFVVQWAGNMGYMHEVDSLFEAMIKLKDRPKIHFIFIGQGSKRSRLESKVAEEGLKNATFLGNRPRSDQPNFLNACDLSISSLISGTYGIAVPSRIYNIMAAGKPVLAIGDPDSEIASIIAEERVGWTVEPGRPDDIAKAIMEAHDNPESLAEMGKRGRAAAESKYSFESTIAKYFDLIEEVNIEGNRQRAER